MDPGLVVWCSSVMASGMDSGISVALDVDWRLNTIEPAGSLIVVVIAVDIVAVIEEDELLWVVLEGATEEGEERLLRSGEGREARGAGMGEGEIGLLFPCRIAEI